MAIVGYARVSTTDQDLSIQRAALEKSGCEKIFAEKQSGTRQEGRVQLDACLDYLREGDTLMVTRIDRLSRSLRDLQNLVHDLKEEGIYLKATEQPIDTSTAAGKAFLDMLGVFAEFETNLRRERQLEGVAKAKKEGKYKGRQPTARAKSQQVVKLIQEGFTREAAADKLSIGIASVYRILKTYQANNTTPLRGSRIGTKLAILDVCLVVENNSKFVRGKKKAREYIENDWRRYYDVEKLRIDGNEYVLKVPYDSEDDLGETVYEMIIDAQRAADEYNCQVEMKVKHEATGSHWG